MLMQMYLKWSELKGLEIEEMAADEALLPAAEQPADSMPPEHAGELIGQPPDQFPISDGEKATGRHR